MVPRVPPYPPPPRHAPADLGGRLEAPDIGGERAEQTKNRVPKIGGGEGRLARRRVCLQAGGVVITNTYPLWIQGGTVRIDSTLQPGTGGGPAVTLGSTGGSGPTTSAQAKWIPINSGGTLYWLPAFQ